MEGHTPTGRPRRSLVSIYGIPPWHPGVGRMCITRAQTACASQYSQQPTLRTHHTLVPTEEGGAEVIARACGAAPRAARTCVDGVGALERGLAALLLRSRDDVVENDARQQRDDHGVVEEGAPELVVVAERERGGRRGDRRKLGGEVRAATHSRITRAGRDRERVVEAEADDEEVALRGHVSKLEEGEARGRDQAEEDLCASRRGRFERMGV